MATVVACDPEQLPGALRRYPHWVVWRNEPSADRPKPLKMPYGKAGAPARANDLASFLSYEAAVAALAAGPYDGLGWFTWPSVPIVIIDLDDCVDPDGEISAEAQAVLDRFPGAYAELSQSGRGIHLIVRGRPDFGPERYGGRKGKVEIYAGRHYLALTGSILSGDRAQVLDRDETAAIEALCRDAGIALADGVAAPGAAAAPAGESPPTAPDAALDALIERARQGRSWKRLVALFDEGDDLQGRQRDSELDSELIRILHEAGGAEDAIIEAMTRSALAPARTGTQPRRDVRARWGEKRGGLSYLRYTVRNILRARAPDAPDDAARIYQAIEPLSALYAAPPPEPGWLVDQIWPAGARGWIAGEAKLGKSWLALALAVAVASGRAFLGRYEVATPGPVLYLTEESNRRKILNRILMLCRGWDPTGRDPIDPAALGPRLHLLVRAGALLTDPGWRAHIRAAQDRIDPRLTIVDPLRRYHLNPENQADEVAPVLEAIASLQGPDRAVAIVHHMRKAALGDDAARAGQQMRGSSDLHAWGDAALYCSGKRGLRALAIEVELKDEAAPDPFVLALTFAETKVALGVDRLPLRPVHLVVTDDADLDAAKVRETAETRVAPWLARQGAGTHHTGTTIRDAVGGKAELIGPALAWLGKTARAHGVPNPRNARSTLWAAGPAGACPNADQTHREQATPEL